MDGKLMAAFIIWAIVGCAFIGLGISAFFSKKAVGFWANAKPFPVEDIKGYNGAVGKLFIPCTALGSLRWGYRCCGGRIRRLCCFRYLG